MIRQSSILVLSVVLSIGLLACTGTGDGAGAVGETAQALAVGDMTTRCFPGVFQPDDAPQCEAQSGVKEFQIGDCNLVVQRKCKLVEIQDALHCCCRAEVIAASPYCDDVDWSDL